MSELLLAIETSAQWTGVALADAGSVLAWRCVESRARHNELLSGLIEELMKETGFNFENLGMLAVSVGPGSFTSLRIGLLTAQGIAVSHSLKIVPVMTLDVLNASFESGCDAELRLPVMDAYKGEVFTALYRRERRLTEPAIVNPDNITALLANQPSGENVAVFGPASLKYRDAIASSLGSRLAMPENPSIAPGPGVLARLAWQRRGDALPPEDVEVFYLRKPDAEKVRHKTDEKR